MENVRDQPRNLSGHSMLGGIMDTRSTTQRRPVTSPKPIYMTARQRLTHFAASGALIKRRSGPPCIWPTSLRFDGRRGARLRSCFRARLELPIHRQTFSIHDRGVFGVHPITGLKTRQSCARVAATVATITDRCRVHGI
jgi:hypothetical protein